MNTNCHVIDERPRAFEQLKFLFYEVSLTSSGQTRLRRIATALVRSGACAVAFYRLRRFNFLILGRFSVLGELAMSAPLIWLRLIGGRHEISCRASIGKGLFIAHACRSIVVHRSVWAGENLYLTGGNVIGVRRKGNGTSVSIGRGCLMGIDAKVIGPLALGEDVRVGAGAVVTRDALDKAVLVGIPAKNIRASESAE